MWSDPVWALAWLAWQPYFLSLSFTFLILTAQGLCDQLPPQSEEKTMEMILTTGWPFQPHRFNVFNAGCAVVLGKPDLVPWLRSLGTDGLVLLLVRLTPLLCWGFAVCFVYFYFKDKILVSLPGFLDTPVFKCCLSFVDIWSLGVILFMLVCGQPPFQEANDSETLTMIMDCKYTVPPRVSAGCRE